MCVVFKMSPGENSSVWVPSVFILFFGICCQAILFLPFFSAQDRLLLLPSLSHFSCVHNPRPPPLLRPEAAASDEGAPVAPTAPCEAPADAATAAAEEERSIGGGIEKALAPPPVAAVPLAPLPLPSPCGIDGSLPKVARAFFFNGSHTLFLSFLNQFEV
jgi:hypothetical protein